MAVTVSTPTEGERDPLPDYAVQDIDHLGLVAGMVDELGLVKLIDTLVPQDLGQRNLSVGLLVKAMILNGLGFIQRALDAIHRYGPTELFAPLAAQAVRRLGLACRTGHLDATSLHTDGQRKGGEAPEVVRVTRGYSRDHRPDLAQVVAQFICENQAGIPVFMKALGGNSSDQADFRATVSAHVGQLRADVGLEYLVADSALYTEAALDAFRQQQKLTSVHDAQVLARPRYTGQGRPARGRAPDAHQHFVQGALASRIDLHRQALDRKSGFIVATNELDPRALPDAQVIDLYKKGQQKVERGFRFLKDPLFAASPLFLKTPQRIMALLMVMTLCLLVYAALEWRVRQALQLGQPSLPDQKDQPTQRPTARWVFQFFSGIRLLKVAGVQTLVLGINQHHRAVLDLLGNRYAELYANSA